MESGAPLLRTSARPAWVAGVLLLVALGPACKRQPIECSRRIDCPGFADLCVEGICVTPCNDATDCADGEQCLGGFCEALPSLPPAAPSTSGDDEQTSTDGEGQPPGAGPDAGSSDDGVGADAGGAGGPPIDPPTDPPTDPVDEVPPAPVAPSDHPWWDASFTRRVPLVAQAEGLVEPVADFPALVVLDESRFDYASAQESGADLRFVDDEGALLPHEVEQLVPGGPSFVWVRLPTLAVEGTRVWLYFGNPAATSVEDAPAVWDAGYEAVHHMGDSLVDSTGRGIDGDPGTTAPVEDGCGLARAFDGVGAIDLGAERDLLRAASGATLSAFVSLDPDVTTAQVLVGIGINAGGSPTGSSRATIEVRSDGTLRAGGRAADTDSLQAKTTTAPLPRDGWHHVAAVISYADADARIYIDGVEVDATGTLSFAQTTTADTPSSSSFLGADDDGAGLVMDGLLDEVRVSRVARSASFIRAEAASIRDRLFEYGAVEGLSTSN